MENEAKKPLELYIHVPFCVKNAITVISFPDLPERETAGIFPGSG